VLDHEACQKRMRFRPSQDSSAFLIPESGLVLRSPKRCSTALVIDFSWTLAGPCQCRPSGSFGPPVSPTCQKPSTAEILPRAAARRSRWRGYSNCGRLFIDLSRGSSETDSLSHLPTRGSGPIHLNRWIRAHCSCLGSVRRIHRRLKPRLMQVLAQRPLRLGARCLLCCLPCRSGGDRLTNHFLG
jgi:hypothetical protein